MKKGQFIFMGIPLILSCCNSCGPSKKVEYEGYIDDNYRSYYHIFVTSFADSNADGIGDLKGITENLDYLRDINDPHASSSLGINGIFLSPIHPSPSYHKYDITNYFEIDPTFGTLKDFDNFIEAAHKRGIRVILDGVFNHISSKNTYFTDTVKKMSGEPLCQVFNPDGTLTKLCHEKIPEVDRFRFVQKDKEFPDQYANRPQTLGLPANLSKIMKYEGFAGGMVDLNLDNQENKDLVKRYIEFWMDRGVDGFRLDAVQSFYGEEKIDTLKNYEFINFINTVAKAKRSDAYIVAEGPWNNAFINYQQNTNIESYFNFSGSFRSFDGGDLYFSMLNDNIDSRLMYSRLESLENLVLDVNEEVINAIFLSNHDIGRVTPSFFFFKKGAKVDVDQLKLFYGLNNLISGNFFWYYGDEIGLYGRMEDDDKANRERFLWGDTRYRTKETIPGESATSLEHFQDQGAQLLDPDSLFRYCHDITLLKDTVPEIARGRLKRGDFEKEGLLSLVKTYKDSTIKILINITQEEMSLDISNLKGENLLVGKLDVLSSKKTKLLGNTLTLPRYSIAVIK